VLASQGDRAGALAAAEKSVTLAGNYAESGPNPAGMRRQIAKSQFTRGSVYETLARRRDASPQQRLADWAAARASFERSRAEWEKLADPTNLAGASARIAECEQGLLSARASR
jgi:hypothetical protein